MRLWLLVVVTGTAWAQTPRPPEPLTRWAYYKEVQPPRNALGLLNFVLDRDVFTYARADQSDLRLYDANGREIPYVLQVRREMDTTQPFAAREFNRGEAGTVAEISEDLGEHAQQTNEVEIDTAGENFRRVVEVQGSADGLQWSTLASGAYLFRFAASGRTVEQKSVEFPVSRYRYLRIRVDRDSLVDRGAPQIRQVLIRRAVKVRGEWTQFPGSLEARAADRAEARPASVWFVDFGGRVPLDRLQMTMAVGAFSRPFTLEAADDPSTPYLMASGTLARSEENASQSLTIDFAEHFARRVKLSVIDDRNAPLTMYSVTGECPAREVVFEAGAASPVRAYYGNGAAIAPRYDLAARLRFQTQASGLRVVLGQQRENPEYRPLERPFSERAPWAVYLVLAVAVVALGWILMGLVRESRGREATSHRGDAETRS